MLNSNNISYQFANKIESNEKLIDKIYSIANNNGDLSINDIKGALDCNNLKAIQIGKILYRSNWLVSSSNSDYSVRSKNYYKLIHKYHVHLNKGSISKFIKNTHSRKISGIINRNIKAINHNNKLDNSKHYTRINFHEEIKNAQQCY